VGAAGACGHRARAGCGAGAAARGDAVRSTRACRHRARRRYGAAGSVCAARARPHRALAAASWRAGRDRPARARRGTGGLIADDMDRAPDHLRAHLDWVAGRKRDARIVRRLQHDCRQGAGGDRRRRSEESRVGSAHLDASRRWVRGTVLAPASWVRQASAKLLQNAASPYRQPTVSLHAEAKLPT